MARKKASPKLTPLELDLMMVLWERGPSTVQEVQKGLASVRRLAYTTVQTMLNVLHRKKKLRRELRERAYVYHPTVSREQVTHNATAEIIDRFFGGSAEELVLSLVESRRLSQDELRKLNDIVEGGEWSS
ncbi:MAG TPA: BlaI/MecI/CopY family transcriptional regulator [Vicinamibacteria bacterium]|nr:BlaI/MecI/CopY family transcriptional regulator [Vicinamibacteria bacterium]